MDNFIASDHFADINQKSENENFFRKYERAETSTEVIESNPMDTRMYNGESGEWFTLREWAESDDAVKRYSAALLYKQISGMEFS